MSRSDEQVPEVPSDPEAGPGTPGPPGPRRRRRWPAVVVAVVVVALVAGVLAAAWIRARVDPGRPGADIAVTIPLGSSTARISTLLGQAGIIRTPRLFTLYVRVKGAGRFEAGDYTFRRHSGYAGALAVLRHGPQVSFTRLTIPEGFTLAQIAARVGKLPGKTTERFLAAAAGGTIRSRYQPPGDTNLEGLLYPATYTVTKDEDEASVLRRMVAAFDDTVSGLGIDQASVRLGLSPYQIVTVASMVEREAKLDDDRGPIASVIYNRLHRNMALGIDATLLYGLHTSTLTRSDLASDNPYNTRKLRGLPPTPIASPGTPSMAAAINPPATPYLYYVLIDQSGRSAFADNPADFEKLKAQAKAKGLLGN